MATLKQAHNHDAVYYGDRPDWVIAISTHRDADKVTQSNWRVAVQRFTDWCPEGEYAIESSSHWAIGWVEFLVVNPLSESGMELLNEIQDQLEDYPLLDEEDYSNLENEIIDRYWKSCSLGERVRLLKDYGDSVFAARCQTAGDLYERAETTYYGLSED